MTLRTRFFALTYDRQMAGTEKAGLRAFREALLAGAKGHVIEIGGGTGANLRCWPGRRVADDNRAGASDAAPPGAHGPRAPPGRQGPAGAEDLPFDDHTFDVAVSTLVLCGADDQPRALRELRRVLRPGGQLLFFEHVRSDDPGTARLQDRVNWLNRLVVCCDCNRPTLRSIQDAGFTITQIEHTTLPKAPKFVRPAIMGSAINPAPAAGASSQRGHFLGWPGRGSPVGVRAPGLPGQRVPVVHDPRVPGDV